MQRGYQPESNLENTNPPKGGSGLVTAKSESGGSVSCEAHRPEDLRTKFNLETGIEWECHFNGLDGEDETAPNYLYCEWLERKILELSAR